MIRRKNCQRLNCRRKVQISRNPEEAIPTWYEIETMDLGGGTPKYYHEHCYNTQVFMEQFLREYAETPDGPDGWPVLEWIPKR